MKAWVIGVIVVILLLVVFVVVFNPFKAPPSDWEQPDQNELDENADFSFDRDVTPMPDYSNVAECQNLNGTEKENCVTQVAVQQLNPALCSGLSGTGPDWCRKEVVVASKNESGCDSLPNPQKNQCHFDFGYGNNSIPSCQKISLAYWRDDCLRFVSQHTLETDACELVSDSDVKDDCFLRVAVGTNDLGLCNRIADSETKGDCELVLGPNVIPDLEDLEISE